MNDPASPAKQQASAPCELCEAKKLTAWHHEDEHCWIAQCEICDVPMVVWKQHGTSPDQETLSHMISTLERVAHQVFGGEPFRIDRVMRQIPDHFHAHARDNNWWFRRFASK